MDKRRGMSHDSVHPIFRPILEAIARVPDGPTGPILPRPKPGELCLACGGICGPWLEHQVNDVGAYPCECTTPA